jgi:hypothetical protein
LKPMAYFRCPGNTPDTSRHGGRSAGPAVRPCGSSSDTGSCRAANKVIRIIIGRAVKNWGQAQDTINATPRRQNRGAVEKPPVG